MNDHVTRLYRYAVGTQVTHMGEHLEEAARYISSIEAENARLKAELAAERERVETLEKIARNLGITVPQLIERVDRADARALAATQKDANE